MGGACPSCGASNPPGAHFCSVCGTGLDAVCPSCGDPLTPGTAACATCGALPEIRHRLRERKRATILFADITGATALGESLDVERLQELMTSFYDAMRQEVEAMGGTVDTFVGDAVLAVFGVPAAHDDDPDRALTAARRMFARLSRLNESLFAAEGVTMDLRIGVNTGDVVVAANDEPELGRIAGDAVNVAARLQEHAAPGSIIVAERTVSTAHAFRFRDLGVVTLRGRTEPVRIYELGAPVHSAERSSRMSAPLVGRDNELSLLETLYDRVAREQVPHLVTIYGAAGVGKSRLVSEFFDALERRGPAPAFLVGRCRPYGESVAYGALADIIKSQASILDDDAPDLAVAKIDTLVRRLAEPSADHERVAEALTYTAGIGPDAAVFPDMSPRQIRAEIRSAWRWLFSKLAQRGDIVVVIEDIHWADPALLDLLEELADRAEGSVLVLCPARPQLTDSRPGWGGGRRSFSSIMLDPLTPEQSSDLLDLLTMSDGLPPEITTQILHRAEGNPFFMEEIIKSLIDSGTVARTADGLRALSGITDVEIPDTVHAVVAARIDLLDADHKRALQCAAVVGRSFWTGVLSFLLGWEESVLEEILEGLERRDLITARIDSEMGDQREYRFRHVLIRDVAYEMLSRTDRSSIHRWVAEWLGGTVGDRRLELVGLRAHHLLNAYDGMAAQREVGSDVELVRSRAQAALVAASAHAKRRVALGEAKHFAREAR
ncbi:MAG TPA: AAA family ATPase, partial [Acidimicrobiia bacterium]